MIDVSFQAWLVSTVSAPFIVQEGKVDFDKSNPWVFFRRASTIQERLLSGLVIDNWQTVFDVEVVGTDIDVVQAQADALKTALQAIAPCHTLGSTFTQAIFVEEHSDEYLARSILDTDQGYHLATFAVQIFHRQ